MIFEVEVAHWFIAPLSFGALGACDALLAKNGLRVGFNHLHASMKFLLRYLITRSIGPIDCVIHTKHRQVFLLTLKDSEA
jgi:hypothetical protein